MPPVELFRTGLAVTFMAVTAYSAARLVSSFGTSRHRWSPLAVMRDRIPDVMHVLTGAGLVLLLLPAPRITSPLLGVLGLLAYGLVATRFASAVRRDGVTGTVASDDGAGHGGYHLHHLVGCAAMMYLWAGAHLVTGDVGIATFTTAPDPGAHLGVASPAGVNWLFGLYFLVAATSLGFRVTEPTVRITHRVALSAATAPAPPAPAARSRGACAGLLRSTAGRCTSEVITSGGIAFVFFSSL